MSGVRQRHFAHNSLRDRGIRIEAVLEGRLLHKNEKTRSFFVGNYKTVFYNIKLITLYREDSMPIIQSLDRALQILDLFDEQNPELRITEMSSRMNLHKSTLHSLLKTLQKHGYIEQDEASGKYRLGLKLLERGQFLLQNMDIRTVARKTLEELSRTTGQTTHLVIRDGREGVYIDKVEGEKAAIRYSRIGRRVPLHTSAVGKVLAAFLPPDELKALLADYAFVRHTPNSITDRETFLAEIERVRKEGCATDREENEPGVRCVAAPVFDHAGKIAGAISISTLASAVGDEALRSLAALLVQGAKDISGAMGFRQPG